MSVTVDQCPCSRDHANVRDRVGVHDRDRVRGRYSLSVIDCQFPLSFQSCLVPVTVVVTINLNV